MKIINVASATLFAMSAIAATAAGPQSQTASSTASMPTHPQYATAAADISADVSGSKWSSWYKMKDGMGKTYWCRNYVSVSSGSRIKYRAYTECNKTVWMTSFIGGTGGGHSRACARQNWCDAVKYVNNKKGKQNWCAGATAVILGSNAPSKYDVRTCIRY